MTLGAQVCEGMKVRLDHFCETEIGHVSGLCNGLMRAASVRGLSVKPCVCARLGMQTRVCVRVRPGARLCPSRQGSHPPSLLID